MSAESIYQLKIPAESLRLSPIIFWFFMIVLSAGVIFVTMKMLAPALSARPISAGSVVVSLVMVATFLLVGYVLYGQRNRGPILVTLYKEGIEFEDSIGLVPLNQIQISFGKMEGLNPSEGSVTTIPLGKALVFKIQNFDQYFNPGFLKMNSPQYLDKDSYKVPVAEGVLSETTANEFVAAFEKLKQK